MSNLELTGQHIVSADQFDQALMMRVFEEAAVAETINDERVAADVLRGHMMTALFYESSTRTSSSFIAASQKLGAGIIPITGVEFSSVSKGETLQDTVRALACYSDTIVLRHPQKGAAAEAAAVLDIPLINAGDGTGEHPTQALLDIRTIWQRFGNLDGLRVAMVGDLKHGRTVHSLARLLGTFNGVSIDYVAPRSLQMPDKLVRSLDDAGVAQRMHTNLADVVPEADVVYMTRVQKERFKKQKDYKKVKGEYIITTDTMQSAKQDMLLMHPLPRVDEISTLVDSDPRSVYLNQQMRSGLHVRMALLAMVNGKTLL